MERGGVGHEIYDDREYETLDEVKRAHWEYEAEFHDPDNRTRFNDDGSLAHELSYILREIEVGDFVWVNRGNTFALCRVTSGWEVRPNLEADEQPEFQRNDIQNFRYVDWKPIPYFAVPGFIRRQVLGKLWDVKASGGADQRDDTDGHRATVRPGRTEPP